MYIGLVRVRGSECECVISWLAPHTTSCPSHGWYRKGHEGGSVPPKSDQNQRSGDLQVFQGPIVPLDVNPVGKPPICVHPRHWFTVMSSGSFRTVEPISGVQSRSSLILREPMKRPRSPIPIMRCKEIVIHPSREPSTNSRYRESKVHIQYSERSAT